MIKFLDNDFSDVLSFTDNDCTNVYGRGNYWMMCCADIFDVVEIEFLIKAINSFKTCGEFSVLLMFFTTDKYLPVKNAGKDCKFCYPLTYKMGISFGYREHYLPSVIIIP